MTGRRWASVLLQGSRHKHRNNMEQCFLNFWVHTTHLHVKHADSNSVGLGWGLRFCIPKTLSGETDAAHPKTRSVKAFLEVLTDTVNLKPDYQFVQTSTPVFFVPLPKSTRWRANEPAEIISGDNQSSSPGSLNTSPCNPRQVISSSWASGPPPLIGLQTSCASIIQNFFFFKYRLQGFTRRVSSSPRLGCGLSISICLNPMTQICIQSGKP